jgi:hypothetical protein
MHKRLSQNSVDGILYSHPNIDKLARLLMSNNNKNVSHGKVSVNRISILVIVNRYTLTYLINNFSLCWTCGSIHVTWMSDSRVNGHPWQADKTIRFLSCNWLSLPKIYSNKSVQPKWSSHHKHRPLKNFSKFRLVKVNKPQHCWWKFRILSELCFWYKFQRWFHLYCTLKMFKNNSKQLIIWRT